MNLRPIRPRDPAIMELLAQLDPREIREQQIQTMLKAIVKHVRQVVATAENPFETKSTFTAASCNWLSRTPFSSRWFPFL